MLCCLSGVRLFFFFFLKYHGQGRGKRKLEGSITIEPSGPGGSACHESKATGLGERMGSEGSPSVVMGRALPGETGERFAVNSNLETPPPPAASAPGGRLPNRSHGHSQGACWERGERKRELGHPPSGAAATAQKPRQGQRLACPLGCWGWANPLTVCTPAQWTPGAA